MAKGRENRAAEEMEVIKVSVSADDVLPAKKKYPIRSTRFTESSFSDYNVMKYEKSNQFSLGFYNLSPNEKKLQNASLVCARDLNQKGVFTQEELDRGIIFAVPIKEVGRLMGYEVDDPNNVHFYKAIKKAAVGIGNKSYLLEEKDGKQRRFAVGHVIDRVLYNPRENEGNVVFYYSAGSSPLFLNNGDHFTVYSLILGNKAIAYGGSSVVDVLEALKVHLFKAEKSPNGRVSIYYDYADFRMKTGYIVTSDKRVQDILDDPRYENYSSDDEIALERLLAIEKLDEGLQYVAMGNKLRVCTANDWNNFRKRVLVPAQETFIKLIKEEPELMPMNFMFEFKPKRYKGYVIGIMFDIYTVDAYLKKQREVGVQMEIWDYADNVYGAKKEEPPKIPVPVAMKEEQPPLAADTSESMENAFDIMERFHEFLTTIPPERHVKISMQDLFKLSGMCSYDTLVEKYMLLLCQKKKVDNPVGWLISAIKDDYQEAKPYEAKKQKNTFSDFPQRDCDYDELLQKIKIN